LPVNSIVETVTDTVNQVTHFFVPNQTEKSETSEVTSHGGDFGFGDFEIPAQTAHQPPVDEPIDLQKNAPASLSAATPGANKNEESEEAAPNIKKENPEPQFDYSSILIPAAIAVAATVIILVIHAIVKRRFDAEE
jgi:hypothetical protein